MIRHLGLSQLRPNNWFLNRVKLENIRNIWSEGRQHQLPPVEVALIDNEYTLIDGHCRAYVALENGSRRIMAEIVDPSEYGRNLNLLSIFHRQGPFIGIKNVADLGKRIVDTEMVERRPIHISLRLAGPAKEIVKK
jgi:hypothetical protein